MGGLGEGGPSCGTARAKGQSDHEFGIWGKKNTHKKAKKSVWLDSMARGEVRSMMVGLWRLGHLDMCGLFSEDNGKPWRVWGQGRVRI